MFDILVDYYIKSRWGEVHFGVSIIACLLCPSPPSIRYGSCVDKRGRCAGQIIGFYDSNQLLSVSQSLLARLSKPTDPTDWSVVRLGHSARNKLRLEGRGVWGSGVGISEICSILWHWSRARWQWNPMITLDDLRLWSSNTNHWSQPAYKPCRLSAAGLYQSSAYKSSACWSMAGLYYTQSEYTRFVSGGLWLSCPTVRGGGGGDACLEMGI